MSQRKFGKSSICSNTTEILLKFISSPMARVWSSLFPYLSDLRRDAADGVLIRADLLGYIAFE